MITRRPRRDLTSDAKASAVAVISSPLRCATPSRSNVSFVLRYAVLRKPAVGSRSFDHDNEGSLVGTSLLVLVNRAVSSTCIINLLACSEKLITIFNGQMNHDDFNVADIIRSHQEDLAPMIGDILKQDRVALARSVAKFLGSVVAGPIAGEVSGALVDRILRDSENTKIFREGLKEIDETKARQDSAMELAGILALHLRPLVGSGAWTVVDAVDDQTLKMFRVVGRLEEQLALLHAENLIAHSTSHEKLGRLEKGQAQILARMDTANNGANSETYSSLLERSENALVAGSISLAEALIAEAKTRRPPVVDKAREEYLHARLFAKRGRKIEAAQHFLSAYRADSGGEKYRYGAIRAYELLDNKEKSRQFALSFLEDFPTSALAHAARIRTAPEEADTRQLVNDASQVGEHADLSLAILSRSIERGEWALARECGEQASRVWGNFPQIWFLMAKCEIDELFHSFPLSDEKIPQLSNERYDMLMRYCSEALKLFSGRELVNEEQAHAHLMRATAHELKGNLPDATADVERAFDLAPNDPAVAYNFARLLAQRGEQDRAIKLLRLQKETDKSGFARYTLAQALLQRGRVEEVSEAIELLGELTRQKTFPMHHKALAISMDALCREERWDDAVEMLDAASALPTSSIAIARAQLASEREARCEKGGFVLGGKEKTICALQNLNDEVPVRFLRILASLLTRYDEHREALAVWRKLFEESQPSASDLYVFLRSSLAVAPVDEALKLLERYRQNAEHPDPNLIFREVELRERSDPASAREILQEYVLKNPNDKAARLRLSLLGERQLDDSLISTDETDYPSADKVDPQTGRVTVNLLRRAGAATAAIKYAYALVRMHFGDVHAHGALRDSMLLSGDDAAILLDTPGSVGPGVAVGFREAEDLPVRWVVFEDAAPSKTLDEHSSSGTLASRMAGKVVGDEFVLASTLQVKKTARIVALKSKYLFRLHESMERLEERFPDQQEMVGFRFPTKSDGELDVEAFLEMFKGEDSQRPPNPLDLHKKRLVTFQLVGRRERLARLYGQVDLINSPDDGPVVCRGDQEEREKAARAIGGCQKIVADTSALLNVFLLGEWQLLSDIGTLIIPHGAFLTLKHAAAGKLAQFERPLRLVEGPEWTHDPACITERLSKFVDILVSSATIMPCTALAQLEVEKQKRLDDLLGPDCTEAILLARAENAVLWIDELVTGLWAEHEFEVARIWTQVLVDSMVERGTAAASTRDKIAAMQLGWGYRFTSISPNGIKCAAELANCNLDVWPFKSVLPYLRSPAVWDRDVVRLASHTIRETTRKLVLPESREAFIVRVLETLVVRDRGRLVVREVYRALRSPHSLIVLPEDAERVVGAWLALLETRVVL